MNIQQAADILAELYDLERGGMALPLRPREILKIEMAGHTVDLTTGEVTIGGGSLRPVPTVAGVEEVNE
jgi:hypothetical protein